MFRSDLKRRLDKIFQFRKTTFDDYSDEFEQDTLFIEVELSRPKISGKDGGLQTARVVGSLVVFSQDNKLPFGYMAKQIEKADPALKANLHFYDIDSDRPDSQARLQNIHERRTSFVFLYDSQYDPDKGEITSLVLED